MAEPTIKAPVDLSSRYRFPTIQTTEYTIDFSDFANYTGVVAQMVATFKPSVEDYLHNIGYGLRSAIIHDYTSTPLSANPNPMYYLGNWGRAFGYQVKGAESLEIGFADGNERLPIYWRVLEVGTKPPTKVNSDAIFRWARSKVPGVNPNWIIKSIRKRGIRRQALLTRYFHLDPALAAGSGVTERSSIIIEESLERFDHKWGDEFTKKGV